MVACLFSLILLIPQDFVTSRLGRYLEGEMDEDNPESKLYDDEEDEDDDAWEEMEYKDGAGGSGNSEEWTSKCLFCSEQFESVPQTFEHSKEVHNFDIAEIHNCFGECSIYPEGYPTDSLSVCQSVFLFVCPSVSQCVQSIYLLRRCHSGVGL